MKVDYLERMKEEKIVMNAGYSSLEKRNMGYIVNTRKAFERVESGHEGPPCDLVLDRPAARLLPRAEVPLESRRSPIRGRSEITDQIERIKLTSLLSVRIKYGGSN